MDRKIFIVEDEPMVARGLSQDLIDLGYQVSGVVSSGELALKKIKEDPPDIVIMDINLEGELDGIETSQRLHDYYNLPIVFMTGFADNETLERALKAGPFSILIKHIEFKQLERVLMAAEALRMALDRDGKSDSSAPARNKQNN